jgi:hypothetical protein
MAVDMEIRLVNQIVALLRSMAEQALPENTRKKLQLSASTVGRPHSLAWV